MEIDSSALESSNLAEFPLVTSNSNYTQKSNSINNNSDIISNNKKINRFKNIKFSRKNKINEELKLSLIQKISKNKINYMNFGKLTLEIINYQKKYMSNKEPLNKYIKNFKNIELSEIKEENLPIDFIKFNKDFINNIKNIKIKKQKKENEKYLSFEKNSNIKSHNYFFSRMNNVEKNNKNKTYEENIILIQKNIRGFLIRIKLNKEISKLVVIYIIKNILKIQKAVRNLLNKKNFYKNKIIKIIQKERKTKANKIIDIFSMYHLRNKYKKILLIKKILKMRKKSANILSHAIKYFLIRKKIKRILSLQKNNYEIIYPLNIKKDIKLKIYYNDNMTKVFNFEFCEIRKINVLYLNNNIILNNVNNIDEFNKNKNEFFCHFFVDGKCIIDNRYKIIKNKFGVIYNLIEFNNKEKKNNVKLDNIKIKIKSIPFNKNNNINNINLLSDKIIKYDTLSSSTRSNKINEENENDSEKINNIKDYNINSYLDSYNNINYNYLNTNSTYKNNLNSYELSENFGNSSSTISNSNNYTKKINYINSKKYSFNRNKKEELNEYNKKTNNKKSKKSNKVFPIFY